jgi:hypothetical protein
MDMSAFSRVGLLDTIHESSTGFVAKHMMLLLFLLQDLPFFNQAVVLDHGDLRVLATVDKNPIESA